MVINMATDAAIAERTLKRFIVSPGALARPWE